MSSDDHLQRLLYDGPTRGENSLDGWDLRVEEGASPQLARMVSIHESFHGQLNDSTAMGTLLHGLAWVVRNRPEDDALRGRLHGPVSRCRQLHEAYATWLSLLVVAEGRPDTGLLGGDPRYLGWFERADGLTGDLRGGYLRYHAVAAGLRATMQGRELHVALERGLHRLSLSELPAASAPDALIRQLCASRRSVVASRSSRRQARTISSSARESWSARPSSL